MYIDRHPLSSPPSSQPAVSCRCTLTSLSPPSPSLLAPSRLCQLPPPLPPTTKMRCCSTLWVSRSLHSLTPTEKVGNGTPSFVVLGPLPSFDREVFTIPSASSSFLSHSNVSRLSLCAKGWETVHKLNSQMRITSSYKFYNPRHSSLLLSPFTAIHEHITSNWGANN